MAIIYTYPRLTNPDGTELIVVSETKNKNSTRLITLSGICDFCSDSACDNTFKTVTTGGDSGISTAVGCDDNLTITSSDASVTITTPVDGTVDIKVPTTPPVDPCPKTYVIKPVECEEGDCVIIEKQETWLYSNDCFFETYAPGYIKDFKVNGLAYAPDGPAGESAFDCYYVQEAVFTATTSNCPTCCPSPDLIVKLTPCGEGSTIETLATNITDWEPTFLDNPCVFLNITVGGEPLTCYQAEVGTVDSGIAVEITSAETQTEPCSCECCLYPCSFTIEPCPGDRPAAFDPIIGSVVQPTSFNPEEACPYSTGELVVITFEGETWCFTLTKVCLAPTISVNMNASPTDCEDEACSGSEPVIRYKWTSCADEEVYFTEDVDPGVAIGTIRRYCCSAIEDEDICYVYAGEDSSSPAVAPPCPTAITDEPDCACCTNPCNYQYTKCPGESPEGFNETIIIDVGKEKESCECSAPNPNIYITNESGETWCYSAPEKTCDPATNVITGIAECGNEEICPETPALTRRYRTCGSEEWLGEDPASPIPTAPGYTGKLYAGSLSDAPCVVPACCVEIEFTDTAPATFPWSAFVAGTECGEGVDLLEDEENCDCCTYYDVATYTRCSEECFIEGFPSVNIDVCAWGKSLGVPQDWKPNTAPNIIKIAIGGDNECCYEKTSNTPCAQETLISSAELGYTDLSTDESWESCDICEAPTERFEFRICGDEEWQPTTSDLSEYVSGDPGTINTWGKDGECYQIRQGELEGGEPLNLEGFNDYTDVEEDPCDCCKNYNVVEYEQCVLESPAVGCASLDSSIYLVNPNYPGAAPSNIVATNGVNSCCYQIKGDTCNSPSDGYSIVEGIELESCGDAICSAPAELKFAYKKCPDATGGTCGEMDLDIVIQAPAADLFDFAYISNGAGAFCCYEKQEESDADPTEGYTIVSDFISCDSLPAECIPDDPTEKWQYVKCAEADGCAEDMDNLVIIEGPASTLSNFLVLQDPVTTNTCCYNKETESELPVTGYTIFGPLGGCDNDSLEEAGCKAAAETPKMLITGEEGEQSGTFPIVDPAAGEEPPFISGNAEDSWFSVQISEEGVPEGTTWQSLYDTEGFFTSAGALTAVGDNTGMAFIPAAGFDGIGAILPGAIYQISIASDFTLNPTVVEGMAGKILFYTPPA